MKRNAEMICLLCQLHKSAATGSHLTPAWMLAPMIGARDNELAHSIDITQIEVESHFGRGRLDNSTTEITDNPHVIDYFFCEECEKSLARLESAVAPFLKNVIYDPKYESHFTSKAVVELGEIKQALRFPSKVLDLFFYSVIWRICLQQRIATGTSQFHLKAEEKIRIFLSSCLPMSFSDLANTAATTPYPYTVITSQDIKNDSLMYVNIDAVEDNPTAFFIAKFIVLVHCDAIIKRTGNGLQLHDEIMQGVYANNTEGLSRIVFLPPKSWYNANLYFGEKAHALWMEKALMDIALRHNLPVSYVKATLMANTNQIVEEEGLPYAKAMSKAYHKWMRL